MQSLTDEEAKKLKTLIECLGDDVLAISAPDLMKRLELDPAGLAAHLKKYFISHDPHAILAGTETLGLPVLVLHIPNPPGSGRISILSAKAEYRQDYERFRTPQTTQ